MKPFYTDLTACKNKVVIAKGMSSMPSYAQFHIPYTEKDDGTLTGWMDYKVYPFDHLNPPLDLNSDGIIWDLFNTNHYYTFSENIGKMKASNSIPMVLYTENVYVGNQVANAELEHGQQVLVELEPASPFEEGYSIWLTRYKNSVYDGWSISADHIFSTHGSQDQDQVKPLVNFNNLFTADSIQKLEKFSKKISKKKISNTNPNISKILKDLSQINFQEQLKLDFDTNDVDDKNIIKEPKVSSFSICSHLTVNTERVNITSKNYGYANVPVNFPICTNPAFAKEDKLTPCGFGLTSHQTLCPCYTPSLVLKKKYVSKGDNNISFHLTESLDSQGQRIYNIVNSDNDQVSYTLSPPEDYTEEQILAEIDSIVQEVLSSWPEEISSTLEMEDVVPQKEQPQEKKSFILSLV